MSENFPHITNICTGLNLIVYDCYIYMQIVYDAYIVCQKVFLISPTFALGQGMMDMMSNQIKTSIFARFGTDVYVEPFTFDLLGWNYVFLGIEGVVFFILAVLLDAFSYCNWYVYVCTVFRHLNKSA